MFSCLYTFLCSHGSTFSWFLCPHMFSSSLAPTRSLVLSSLHALMFYCLHMFSVFVLQSRHITGHCGIIIFYLWVPKIMVFLAVFQIYSFFFYYSITPLVLKISKVLKPGFKKKTRVVTLSRVGTPGCGWSWLGWVSMVGLWRLWDRIYHFFLGIYKYVFLTLHSSFVSWMALWSRYITGHYGIVIFYLWVPKIMVSLTVFQI